MELMHCDSYGFVRDNNLNYKFSAIFILMCSVIMTSGQGRPEAERWMPITRAFT